MSIHSPVWFSINCQHAIFPIVEVEHERAFSIPVGKSYTEFLWGWFHWNFAKNKGICLVGLHFLIGELVKR